MGIEAIPLRTQPDRRLVRLVREGYESAFEEIVRRYRRPLDRFAASIVGGRFEDVTQDSFRKALVALRRGDAEIDLRPWLYRIVRNTALSDLRDRPPAAAELAEELMAGGRSAAAVAEERAEVAALTARLRALPEKQRAALVMRELEGMGHEEIATALGVSGGAARQAIARGRATVRGGLGAFVPLPLLRALVSGGGDAATETAVGTGAAATGLGALKVGLATVVVAGGIGAGVAIDHGGGVHHAANPPQAVAPRPAPAPGGPSVHRVEPPPATATLPPATVEVVDDHVPAPAGGHGGGSGPSGSSGGHDSGEDSGDDGSGHDSGDDRSGHGASSDASSGGSGSGSAGPTSDGHGSDDLAEPVVEAPPVETLSAEPSSSGGPGPSSSSGGDGGSGGHGSDGGSGSSGGHGSDDDPEISP